MCVSMMEAVLLGLEDVLFTRQGLLWTFTSSALRHLRALHLTHAHRCVPRPLYQVGYTSLTHTQVCAVH